MANANLTALGHVSFKANGSTDAQLPGDISLENVPLPQPASHFYLDGRQGLHTEHLGLLLAEMQFLPRAYPDATW